MSNRADVWLAIARAWSPLLIIAAVMVALQVAAFAHPALTDLLEWSRNGMVQGQWWRLLTGHWVHLGTTHLLLNVAGLALLGLLFDRPMSTGWLVGYLLTAPVAISLGLAWAVPELDWYRGFSGCLHGLFVMLALANLRRQPRWNGLLLTGLAAKLMLEPYLPGSTAGLIGAPVIYQAHGLGALTGLVAGLAYNWTHRPRDP